MPEQMSKRMQGANPVSDAKHGAKPEEAFKAKPRPKPELDPEPMPKPIPNGISSSISGPGIGDDVALKRAHLMDAAAQADPHLGRRPSPEPYDPWPTRWMYIKGMLAGAVVIVIVFVILIVVGGMSSVD